MLMVGMLIVAGGALAIFAMMRCENRMDRTLAGINDTFSGALQIHPEIRINQTVVYAQTAAIAELAVVSKEQLIDYTYLQDKELFGAEIPFTHKKIVARALYQIKAGFDLRERFIVTVNPETGKIEAELPPAKILSIELINAPTLTDEGGALNPVTAEERQQVLDGLNASAKRAAFGSGLVEDAEKQVLARLQEISRQNGQVIQFNWQGPGLP
jgi:hypothetical protein